MFLDILQLITTEIIRILTGRLFTQEQIRLVSKHAVGRYFADFLPEPNDERMARERVEEALEHITHASNIITQLQVELGAQTQQLDAVLREIEQKKQLATKYEELAKTGKEQFSAFRSEMEAVLRRELETQSEKGKTARKIVSALLWVVTLVLGAALGTYFKEVIDWMRYIF